MNIQVFPGVLHSGPHPDFKHCGNAERNAAKGDHSQSSLCSSLVWADLTSRLEHLQADAGSSCCEALDWQYQVSQQSQTSRLTWQVARNRQCQVVRCQQPGVVIRKWLPPPIVRLQTLCCQENRCSRIQPKQSLLPKETSRRLSLTACSLLSSYTGHCWQHLLSAKEKFP